MIYCDEWIKNFLMYNIVTVQIIFMLLKELAKRNKNFGGDSIIDLFSSYFEKFSGKK